MKRLLLALIIQASLLVPASVLAAFSTLPETPVLTGAEYVDLGEMSPRFVLYVIIPQSAFGFQGSYHGSGTAELEISWRQGSGDWLDGGSVDLWYFTPSDEATPIIYPAGGIDPSAMFRVRINHSYTRGDGEIQSESSDWSEAVAGEPGNEDNSGSYSNASGWAKPELDRAAASGLITDAVKDKMSSPITREELAGVAVRLYERLSGVTAGAAPDDIFIDCENPEVLKAHNLGIVSGVGGGRFDPGAIISREQMAAVFWHTLLIIDPDIEDSIWGAPTYSDEALISPWARHPALYMGELGFIKGIGSPFNERFDPRGSATCEQVVVISLRIYESFNELKNY